jgi:ribonucleoside-triphosphate reductase
MREEAEVYSRITGYYRPVKNWNDGKLQEFKDRKVYAVGQSDLQPRPCQPAPEHELLLFVTSTCANCAIAKKALADARIAYRVVDAGERQDLVEQYGVRQAPALVSLTGNGAQVHAGLVGVRNYIDSHSA